VERKTPKDYVEMAIRRKWFIIVPFVVVIIGSFAVYKRLPRVYRATTVILVQPQKVPTSYVESTVTLSVTDRLSTISQQILSRTSLEQVIEQIGLLGDSAGSRSIAKKVELMRRTVNVEVNTDRRRRDATTSSFSISYDDGNPVTAAQIVNKIASLFITENLKVREEQARSTSRFLQEELVDTESKLKEKEESIRKFKEAHMGELPAQLDTNLRILDRLQQQVQTNSEFIISAQQRKAGLENQIAQTDSHRSSSASTDQAASSQDPLLSQLGEQRRRLQELETQYTGRHPDVLAAKESLQRLEAEITKKNGEDTIAAGEATLGLDPILSGQRGELQDVIVQIARLEREQENLKDQIVRYQQRVENVPKTEERMSTLLRDYTLLQENYQSLLEKKIQAQLAENLERSQKGEQFRILDPATPPTVPIKPDKKRVFGLTFILGLVLGFGSAFLREQMDRSFYKEEEIENFLGSPVIGAIPRIEAEKARRG
jgi:polysaccharide chain length determinant protein (PEP-CTERM system associated)